AVAFVPAQHALPWLALAAPRGGSLAPLLLTMPLEIRAVGPMRAGAALGLLMLVGQLGGFVLPIAIGFVKDGPLGFSGAMILLAIVHASVLVPLARLPETGASPAAVRAKKAVA